MDKDLKLVARFPGYEKNSSSILRKRSPNFSFEGDKIIWFGGNSCLCILDLTNLNHVKIQMINKPTKDIEPICGVADFYRNKILVYYEIKGVGTLVYNEPSRGNDIHILGEIFPRYQNINDIDLTKNKLFACICGLQIDKSRERNGALTIVTFEKSLEIMGEIRLPKNSCSEATSLQLSPTQNDVLFLGTDGPLYIVSFNTGLKKIEVMKSIDLHSKCNKIFYFSSD